MKNVTRQQHQTRASHVEDDRNMPSHYDPSQVPHAPMTEDSQDLSVEEIMRLMHGWPGKTLFWLLSRTTPAARTVPRFGRLKPLLFHIPFGFVTSLSCP